MQDGDSAEMNSGKAIPRMQENASAEAKQGNAFAASPFLFANPSPPVLQDFAPWLQENPPAREGLDVNPQNPQGAKPRDIPNNPFDFQGSTNENVPGPSSRLTGSVTNEYYEYLPLSQAISHGDLQAVKDFLNRRPDAITTWIDTVDTPLLKACSCGHPGIVKELLRRMAPEQVLTPREDGILPYPTPLSAVASNGELEIAEALVAKYPKLLEIPGPGGQIPVVTAANNAQKEMARFLYHKTPFPVFLEHDGFQGTLLLLHAIFYGMLDIALDIFEACPRMAVTRHPRIQALPLTTLAARPDLFPSGCDLGFWRRFIYSCIEVKLPTDPETSSSNRRASKYGHSSGCNLIILSTLVAIISLFPFTLYQVYYGRYFNVSPNGLVGIDQIYELKEMHQEANKLLRRMSKEVSTMGKTERLLNRLEEAIFFAARYGNNDFLVEMIRSNSDFLWVAQNSSTSNLFLLSVEFRQEKVFNLFYGLDKRRQILIMACDNSDNGILHIAGRLSPPDKLSKVVGASLKMQREIQWFKEIERIVPEIEKERQNLAGLRPREIFEESHEPLRKEAEKWMKYTATSCSLVAALIATVTFQAIFTAPGGTDDISGDPLRLREPRFMVFIIADILSFFASCTSVLIFLGILTARYSFDDFLVSLPSKMISGLSILFISVAAMLVAFSAALFTSLYKTPSLVIPVLPLTCLPTALFVLLQYPLLKEMISSTYGRGLFNHDTKRWL